MAFKILNDEEISLLTDEQVECYQKELKIYKQREAFVEKLDSLFTVDSSLDGETEPEINRYYQGNRVCTFHKSRAAKAQSETYAKA